MPDWLISGKEDEIIDLQKTVLRTHSKVSEDGAKLRKLMTTEIMDTTVIKLMGIAKLLVADCEVLEKAGLCCHFDGVIGPEAERIAAA
jgi:hypothetical protein